MCGSLSVICVCALPVGLVLPHAVMIVQCSSASPMGSLSSILFFFFLLLWSLFVALSLSMSSQSSQMVMNHLFLVAFESHSLSFFFLKKKIEVCTCVCFHMFMRSCMHMCMRMCGGVKGIVHAITCLRRTEEEDDFVGLVLSFHLYIVTGH